MIQFRRAPFVLFRDTPVENLMPNQLVMHIQPEEGISLRFGAKVPGPMMRLGTVDMDFDYADYFGKQPSTGYERLLHDCMVGDATLFQRADMVEAGWSVVSPILDVWKAFPHAISRTTRRAPGDPKKPTPCSSTTAAIGGISKSSAYFDFMTCTPSQPASGACSRKSSARCRKICVGPSSGNDVSSVPNCSTASFQFCSR